MRFLTRRRDFIPRSSFSFDWLQVAWDVLSVFLLIYVTSSVPVRACFGVPDVLWTAAFWFDVFVDLYFVADIGAGKRA
eukprot:COSAG06_NODE_28082_length_581_cov_0.715768_1_plen_78_part_00